MQSITYGEVSIKEIVDIIEKRVNERPYSNFQVVVGTDSQNFDKTKIVLVIALLEETKGGIFFYDPLSPQMCAFSTACIGGGGIVIVIDI